MGKKKRVVKAADPAPDSRQESAERAARREELKKIVAEHEKEKAKAKAKAKAQEELNVEVDNAYNTYLQEKQKVALTNEVNTFLDDPRYPNTLFARLKDGTIIVCVPVEDEPLDLKLAWDSHEFDLIKSLTRLLEAFKQEDNNISNVGELSIAEVIRALELRIENSDVDNEVIAMMLQEVRTDNPRVLGYLQMAIMVLRGAVQEDLSEEAAVGIGGDLMNVGGEQLNEPLTSETGAIIVYHGPQLPGGLTIDPSVIQQRMRMPQEIGDVYPISNRFIGPLRPEITPNVDDDMLDEEEYDDLAGHNTVNTVAEIEATNAQLSQSASGGGGFMGAVWGILGYSS